MNKIALGMLFASSTVTVHAQHNDLSPMIRGDHVIESPASEYKDYLVKISTPTGGCGGGLIAGRFVLTAGHCAEVEGGITIWQGVDAYSDSAIRHSTNYKLHTIQRGIGYAERLTYIKSMYEALGYLENDDVHLPSDYDFVLDDDYIQEIANYPADQAIGQETGYYAFTDHLGNSYPLFLDLAILELETPVPHNTSFAMGFVRDENYQQTLPVGQVFTFKGWGLTEDENGNSYHPSRLMQGELQLAESELDDNCLTDVEPPLFSGCYPNLIPTLHFTYPDDPGQGVGSGDSGTPILLNDVAYGVGSTVSRITPYQSRFYEFAPHKEFILNAINEVTTPNLDTIKVPVLGNGQSFDYVVQNLTNSVATIDIDESGSVIAEGYAVINHDCSTELNSFEYCTVSMDIRKSGYGHGSYVGEHDFTIAVINGIPRTVTFDIPNVTTTTPLEDGERLKSNGTNITIDTAGNQSVRVSHAENTLYIEFTLGTELIKASNPIYTVRDGSGNIYGQCTKDTTDELVTCAIENDEYITGYAQSYDFTLYEGEASIDELTVNVTTSAPTNGESNSGGSGSSSGGGSFGPFGLLALLLVGIYRRIRK